MNMSGRVMYIHVCDRCIEYASHYNVFIGF